MTYIPIVAPVIFAGNRNGRSVSKSARIMIFSGLLVLIALGFLFLFLNNGIAGFSISLNSIPRILMIVVIGLVVFVSLIYRVEMSYRDEEIAPKSTEMQYSHSNQNKNVNIETQTDNKYKSIPYQCNACKNQLDDTSLKGLIDKGHIFCQYCGEKIYR
jgi:hypothetical protein